MSCKGGVDIAWFEAVALCKEDLPIEQAHVVSMYEHTYRVQKKKEKKILPNCGPAQDLGGARDP